MKENALSFLERYWHVLTFASMGLASLIKMNFRVKANTRAIQECKHEVNQKFELMQSQHEQIQQNIRGLNKRIDQSINTILEISQANNKRLEQIWKLIWEAICH